MPDTRYNVYRHERDRRRWPYVALAAACVLAVFAVWQVLGVPRVSAVTPGPDSYVKNQSQTIILDVHGLPKLTDVHVTLDGADVTDDAQREGDRLTFTTGSLDDGTHDVSFTATSSNLIRHQVEKAWRFTVDTRVPTLELEGSAEEGRLNTSPATFSGSTEPYATVTVTSGTLEASGTADATGKYAVSIELPQGPSDVTITTTDRAGNATTKQIDVYVDEEPPTLKATQLDDVIGHSGLKIRVKATDNLGAPKLKIVLDGATRAYSGSPERAVFTVKNLAQGRHTLVISAGDKGGNVVDDRQVFVVDSTEHFGSATLWPGARGKDVKALQHRLADQGVYSGSYTGVYGSGTEEAVRKFQAKCGLAVDGIVGGDVLTALCGEIVVDLSELHLYLYRDGDLVTSYSVAAGQAKYPTPTGTYSITTMTKNPTWYPPNSEWAKDAKPIPPGIDNPLGTRWIGTSASGVGIHGTPDDASIGTYASHGCIRMHIWDVEDLFDRVSIGMTVVIRQ